MNWKEDFMENALLLVVAIAVMFAIYGIGLRITGKKLSYHAIERTLIYSIGLVLIVVAFFVD